MLDRLNHFFVFDSQFGISDQSPGDILYYFSNDEKINQDVDRRFIVTGICTAIINLCTNFNTSSSCDYLITENCEMSFLPIGEGLFFFISLKLKNNTPALSCYTSAMMSMAPLNKGLYKYDSCLSPFQFGTTNSRKQVLQNVLQMIKKILFLNVEPPKRDQKSGKFSDSFKSSVNFHLPIILDLFDWNDLSITHLWRTSVFISKLPTNVNHEFRKELERLHSENDFIYGLILNSKNQVVAHTTEPELTNILSFLVSHKYRIYYPYSVKNKENVLHWTIGYNDDLENGNNYNSNFPAMKTFSFFWNKSKSKKDFVNLITPPLIWKDKNLALAALKYNQVTLIIIFDPLQVDVDKDLGHFKDLVAPILIKCDSFNNENSAEIEDFKDEIDSRFKKKAGAKLFCNFKKGKIQLLMNRIQNADIDLIKYGVVFANESNFFIRNELMKKNMLSFFTNSERKFRSELNSMSETSVSVYDEDSVNYSLQCNEFEIFDLDEPKNENDESKIESKSEEKFNDVHTKSLIPLNSGFFLFFEQKNEKFTNIFIKNKQKGISGALKNCQAIDDCI